MARPFSAFSSLHISCTHVGSRRTDHVHIHVQTCAYTHREAPNAGFNKITLSESIRNNSKVLEEHIHRINAQAREIEDMNEQLSKKDHDLQALTNEVIAFWSFLSLCVHAGDIDDINEQLSEKNCDLFLRH